MTKLEFIAAGIEGDRDDARPVDFCSNGSLASADDRRNESRKNAILDIGLKQMLVSNPKLRSYLSP
jgi:hypothetical protein